MELTASRHLTYKLLSVLPAVLCAAVLAVVRTQSPDSFAVAVVCAAVCAVLAVLAFAIRKQFAPAVSKNSAAITFASALSGCLLLACFAASVYFYYLAPIEERFAVINGTVTFLTGILTLLAAVYFLVSALAPSLLENKAARLLWAATPILFCAFRILSDFIATGTMPLANGGGYHILGMIATMLFFLCEGKITSERGKTFTYLACGQIAVVLNAAYNIPLLVSFSNGGMHLHDVLYGVLFLALSLYIAFRLFTFPHASQEEIPQEEPQA